MSAQPIQFDPTRHLSKVSGRDYLEVKWRIVWARSVFPSMSIVTELTNFSPDSAVFKATVSWPTEDGIVQCTGWGSEEITDFGDYLEKAETKAIGRALGAAGFGTQFCDDHDFGSAKQRVVDSPTDIRTKRTPKPAPPTDDDLDMAMAENEIVDGRAKFEEALNTLRFAETADELKQKFENVWRVYKNDPQLRAEAKTVYERRKGELGGNE